MIMLLIVQAVEFRLFKQKVRRIPEKRPWLMLQV